MEDCHGLAHHVDWDAGIIRLNRTWLYGYVGEGKSEESRKPVPMVKRVTEFLREWHRETPYAGATDWVFPSFKLKGKRPISGSPFVKDYIRPRFINYGLIDAEYKGRAGLHAFRHSLATVLITEGTCGPENGSRDSAPRVVRHHNGHLHARAGRSKKEGA